MDLTCPSFVHDETSDYGSRDTSDSENVISGVSIIETPSEMTVIFRGTQLFSWGKDFERELYKFASNIRAVAPCAEGDLVVLTGEGIFMFIGIQMSIYFPPVVRALLQGDFRGLDVLGAYSIAPIVVTTEAYSGFIVVNMIDFETGEVFRKIPVSCLTTDIVRSSMITKLAVDTETKDLYITDSGNGMIVKIGLLKNSCTQFGWSGDYKAANVKWTVPTKANVMVCLFVDGGFVLLTIDKTGFILKHERLGYTAIDGVATYDMDRLLVATETDVLVKMI